jgi:Domain of unknown function (DUF4158)
LKFYTGHGRFPRGRGEFPPEVVEHVAKQTKSETADFGRYDWTGRTAERHRQEIRGHLGFRECSVADAGKLTDWLAANVAHAERDPGAVRDELLRKMREESFEPPTDGRLDALVAEALQSRSGPSSGRDRRREHEVRPKGVVSGRWRPCSLRRGVRRRPASGC